MRWMRHGRRAKLRALMCCWGSGRAKGDFSRGAIQTAGLGIGPSIVKAGWTFTGLTIRGTESPPLPRTARPSEACSRDPQALSDWGCPNRGTGPCGRGRTSGREDLARQPRGGGPERSSGRRGRARWAVHLRRSEVTGRQSDPPSWRSSEDSPASVDRFLEPGSRKRHQPDPGLMHLAEISPLRDHPQDGIDVGHD